MKLPNLIGVTHNEAGEVTARVPRTTKVSIGKPKGKAVHACMVNLKDGTRGWLLEIGVGKQMSQRGYKEEEFHLLARDYAAERANPATPDRKFPEKLPYFTFTKDAGDGSLVLDLDVIRKMGPRPRSIDIILTDDEPLVAAYEWWSAKGLICRGNGVDAMRVLEHAKTPEEKALAEECKEAGLRTFPIIGGCASKGCPIRNMEKGGCKPHGRLSMQLINDIRLGAKAEFSTTGFRSISQLAASLLELATFTGGGDHTKGTVRGIPLQLSLNKFKTNHNGTPGTAYAVRLEFRAESIPALRAKLIDAAQTFGMTIGQIAPPKDAGQVAPTSKQLAAPEPEPAAEEAPTGEVVDAEFEDADGEVSEAALVMDAEFDTTGAGGDEDDFTPDQEPQPSYSEAKAALMKEAEMQAGDPPAGPAVKSDALFAAELGGDRYTDPGEQNDAPPTSRKRLKF